MADPPGTLRRIGDPQAEMERLARAHAASGAAGIKVGDIISVHNGGQSSTGRVARVDPLGEGRFSLYVEPLGEEEP